MTDEPVITNMKEELKQDQPQEHHEAHDHVHGDNCNHEHEDDGKKEKGGEKKVRKALSKLGMTKMEGVNRVTVRQKDNYILVVKDPEVYSSQQAENTFIIFGEITFEDPDKKMAKEEIEKMAGKELVTEKAPEQKQQVTVVEEEGEVSEEGLDAANIDTVIAECKVTRQKAVKALRNANGDVVSAILSLS